MIDTILVAVTASVEIVSDTVLDNDLPETRVATSVEMLSAVVLIHAENREFVSLSDPVPTAL